MALIQFAHLKENLRHRQKIARIYASLLPEGILMLNKKETTDSVSFSSNLRFPIFVDNRSGLIKKLAKHGVYVSDIWYHDVAPDCPNAIRISKRILNLPTHINVSEPDAKKISLLIKGWTQES
jgi:dTDP-4-amino-4,6-dideoxygalactose transaminase